MSGRMGMIPGTGLLALAGAVVVLMMTGAPSASAAPLVQSGGDLANCATAGRGALIASDGSRAVRGPCVYSREEGVWVLEAELPQSSSAISADGNTLLGEPDVLVRSGETWSEETLPESE